MRSFLSIVPLALLLGGSARAGSPVEGDYDSPLGRIRIAGDGTSFRGTLLAPSSTCPFTAGDQVMRATLLDDSLAGEVRVHQTGCGAAEAWAPGVLLVGPAGLFGAVHVAAGCRAPLGRNGGISFTRAPPPAAATAGTPTARVKPGAQATERARAAMRDGAIWLSEGNFEKARVRFEEAVALDRRLPEAYNGVGVTWRMRDHLALALQWYKQALSIDPDFGDAYYNMACVYALSRQPDLALRYLQIALVNGYATAEGIGGDPDLASLRDLPAYRALVRAGM
jgi:hypothetical protein